MNVSPESSGKIKLNEETLQVSYPYTRSFPVNTNVVLKALPAFGYDFVEWSGDITGDTNPDSTMLTCDTTVTANFLSQGEPDILYFPHIASNIGDWETEICVINISDEETLNGIFRAYDNSGNSASEDIEATLAPRGRREITVGGAFVDPEDIGYILFEAYSEAMVGYTKFYIKGQYRVAVPAIPDSEINTGDIYISHIASGGATYPWFTGLSLLNTTSLPKALTIEFDNSETKTVSLAANEHKAFTVRSLFGGVAQPGIQSGVIKDANGVIGLELFTSNALNWMSGILLKDDTTISIYYPHTASGGGWATGIVAYNPATTPCDITITPYSVAGDALTPATDTIGAKARYIGTVSLLGLPVDTAWLQIGATSPITGFELFTRPDLLGGYTGVGISGREGIFAKIEKDGYTGIAFVNIENSSAVVTLTAYNDSGAVIATETINLNAYEKVVNSAENIFTENISSATYITYSSDLNVVGFQLNASSDGMMLDALPVIGNVATYTARGTYTYDPGTGILTLNTTSSDFECEGPEIGTEEIPVSSITSTTMTWPEQDGDVIWTRDSGISGDIVGTWESYDDSSGNSWEATFNSDGSFSMVGFIVECENGGNGNGGDISMITPYVNESDMADINPAYSETTSAPWGFKHGGLDPHPIGDLKPFRAVASGVVDEIDFHLTDENWQVTVIIKYNSTYSHYYGFEPMSPNRADGETQLANITVSVGQTVSQGDIIGHLLTSGEGAHVHFGLFKYVPNGGDPVICPEPYFTPEARDSILRLIHKDNPDWNMCY